MLKARELLSIDTRSLALLRVCLSALVLIDLFNRSSSIEAFYTDSGVLPAWALKYLNQADQFHWSLHLLTPDLFWLSGSWFWQAFLFSLATLAAFCMLIGYQTRWATVITCVLLISLQTRQPLICNGGDNFLRNMVFWSMFLPLGEQFSLDQKRLQQIIPPRLIFSAATTAAMAQVCFVYWVAAVTKSDPQWTESRTALYYALHLDFATTDIGRSLLQFPTLLQWLTAITLWLEFFGPILVFCPIFTSRVRLAVILIFVAFHLGIGLCMHLGLFTWICIVSWSVFLPRSFWEWIANFYQSKDAGVNSSLGDPGTEKRLSNDLPPIANGLVALLLVYAACYNLHVIFEDANGGTTRWFNRTAINAGHAIGLDQRYKMFSPKPTVVDGWFVAVATLEDGNQVDLMKAGDAVSWKKPESLSERFPSKSWQVYLHSLKLPSNLASGYRPFYVDYLKRRWKKEHGNDPPIDHVELYLMLEITPPFPEQPQAKKTLIYRDSPRYDVQDYLRQETIDSELKQG